MAAPSYTEDLTDIDLAQATTNWAESTATGWTDGGSPTADADYPYIQDTIAITQTVTKAGIGSLLANAGTGLTLPTDGAYFVWQCFSSNRAVDSYANGGLRVMVGSALNNFKAWTVGGNDKGFYPYGGWQNHAVNTTVSADFTVTGTGSEQYIGAAVKSTAAIGKGNPHAVDAVRYGRGSSIFQSGDLANGYCTFLGFTNTDETNTNRWGLARKIPGGFLWKGRMQLGTSGTAVDFRDANASVVWDETPKVTANFNLIEVNHASSRIDWTNVIHKCTSTVSRTRLLCNADADLNWDLCQFFDMGSLTFGGTTGYCTNATFSNCGQVTPAGANLSGSKFLGYEGTADTSYLIWNYNGSTSGKLDSCQFTKGTAATHAIEIGTSVPDAIGLVGVLFTSYGANETTSSAIHNKRTANTIASYAEANSDGYVSLYSGSTTRVGQSFTTGGSGVDLSAVRFYLKKTGAPTGDLVVKLYATSAGAPTGSALVTSETLSAASLSTSVALIKFRMANSAEDFYGLAASTTYFLAVEFSGGTASDTVDVGRDNSSSTGSGTAYSYAGSWASQTYDLVYYFYSDGNLTITVSSGGSTPSVKNEAFGNADRVVSGVTVTLTGLKTSTEVRVFYAGTQNEVPGTGAEDIDGGSHSFSLTSGLSVDLAILCLGYQNMRVLAQSWTANTSVPISQVLDRQYWNG